MSDPLETKLTRALNCRWPIIQTAMGWVATPDLVIATSAAGCFGFLAGAVMTPSELRAAIAQVKAGTARPFGVNFHMFQPGAAEIVEIVLEERAQVRAVSFGRGPDARMIGRFKDAGILCIPTIGAVKHAQKMAQHGVDMVVVQGGEGGGHTGAVASSILLPQVLDAVDIPVIAAGGFSDGRGLVAALAYGAAGIAMGTRFLMTSESPLPAITKACYVKAGTDDILVSSKVDGMPQRMIRNPLLDKIERSHGLGMWWRGIKGGLAMRRDTGASLLSLFRSARNMTSHGGLTFAQALLAAAAPTLIRRAVEKGDVEGGLMATGLVAGRINDLPSCAELVAAIITQARSRLTALSGVA